MEGTENAAIRFLVSLELARMTSSFDLELIKVTVILNSEERGIQNLSSDCAESIIRLCSGEGEFERIVVCC
ncbi:hypothetical protein VDIAB_30034 [Vibrio diabolicus]|nr:hypothetical protein VDIAB_30034 [Vibrio diabolicus]